MRLLLKLIKALNSETDPAQISLGMCFGLVAGLTQILSLHNLLVLLLVLLLRVNISAFIASGLLFSGVAWAIDPYLSRIGLAVLQAGALEGLWTSFYNMTVFRLDRFNNSIVMGSLVTSLALFAPLFFMFSALIRQYRERVLGWINRLKIMQTLKASRIYGIYDSLTGWDV
ncbi:MAG: TIGR03546 family protein [Thermodesulfovibrionales bacterium]|nr:TIGR03546 family protein [Thermodesulfovibrionales bacterium]